MDERKKIFLVIIAGLAGLFLLTARFYIPLIKDNAQRAAQYKQLKIEVGAIGEVSKNELTSLEKRINTAISNLERRFSPEGKLKLMEQLTRVPEGANIVFTDIAYKEPEKAKEYQLLPLEVNMKAPFYDLMKYLAEVEASPLMIGIDNLNIRKAEPEVKSLDIKVTFLGFRLIQEFPSISKYLEDKYKPFDKQRLEELLKPVNLTDTKSILSRLKDYNPFYYDRFQMGRPQPETTQLGSLSLKGIMHLGDRKVALINDTMVREGEEINGMQVLEIQDYKVVLMQSGKKYILKMGIADEFIKR